ncbi:hypothetical protein NEFER03_0495 [Nematocida sp. LUAm3]|nr:hypothetical protein NEFER03_0495 [Nematocida sp. LUAm3]KAI5175462.1 hypothetical protein NEFER02_1368 [Nematocida sp. LUAm2]KAI5179442.1 hypothetical protein NEFER01_2255 [Nematocida sp. LUAm1]
MEQSKEQMPYLDDSTLSSDNKASEEKKTSSSSSSKENANNDLLWNILSRHILLLGVWELFGNILNTYSLVLVLIAMINANETKEKFIIDFQKYIYLGIPITLLFMFPGFIYAFQMLDRYRNRPSIKNILYRVLLCTIVYIVLALVNYETIDLLYRNINSLDGEFDCLTIKLILSTILGISLFFMSYPIYLLGKLRKKLPKAEQSTESEETSISILANLTILMAISPFIAYMLVVLNLPNVQMLNSSF